MAVNKIQTGLRINERNYQKLKTLCQQESRSINNYVEYIIQKYLDAYEAENGSIPLAPFPDD